MGHDFYAIQKRTDKPIAHLRLSANRGRNAYIYHVLDAVKFRNVDSGTGGSKEFTKLQIRKAFNTLGLSEEEKKFLKTCLDNSDDDTITIRFA